MAKVLATKPDGLNLIPKTQLAKGKPGCSLAPHIHPGTHSPARSENVVGWMERVTGSGGVLWKEACSLKYLF